MNIKQMGIAVILVVGIIAAGLIAMVVMGGGLYTRGPAQQTIGITGTVTYIDLEGGFYGIVADDGTQYLPLDLPEEFRQDGRAVTAEVIVRDDVATIQQWGTPVEIVDINAPATVAVNGTVTYIDLEGGFYGIVADDGTQYLPLDLPEEFRQDGRAVTAEVIVRDDVATIQQWGTPVEIAALEAA